MKSKWLVLFLIWLMMLVAYFDRVNLSVASTSIMGSLHLNKAQFGFAIAAFTLGYGFMQAPGGHFADRFGSRKLLIVAIFFWSLFTGITGFATSLVMLIGIRVIFGAGEGLENGAQFKLVGEYFEPKERALANSIFLSALALGPALGTPLATAIIVRYGWPPMFYFFAAMGVVMGVILIWLLPRDSASTESGADREAREASQKQGFAEAIRRPTSWLCAGSYMLFNAAFWGFVSWVPTYLREDRHIPLAKSGLIGALPYLAGFLGMVLAGTLGSTLFSKRRSILVAGCYVGGATGFLLALSAQGISSCVAGLCVAAFFMYGGFGPFWAVAIDLAPPQARGVFTGSVNCCGQIGAFSSQLIVGYLANSMKSFTGAILFMTGALLLSAVVMVSLQKLLNVRIQPPVAFQE